MIPIVCLMGPTASGKTDLALELARSWPFEVISVDSAMVYCGMDIGTAKPSQALRQEIPHHLIDVCTPPAIYSAGDFVREAEIIIADILQRGRWPLLVGGSMLYFHALQHGLAELPTADPQTRAEIQNRAQRLGWPAMHQELQQADPQRAAQIHPNDRQRIARALELVYLGAKTTAEQWQQTKVLKAQYAWQNWVIQVDDREQLRKRIQYRFLQMFELGWLDEVKRLRAVPGVHANFPPMRAVGYRQLWQYLEGELSLAQMQEQGIIATCQLAKRQMTWLKRWPEATPLNLATRANQLAPWLEQYAKQIKN